MSCWTDGELRAYVDRELPADDRDRLAAHLTECGECESRYREIAARAERVTGALRALSAVPTLVPSKPAPPARLWPRWAAAGTIAAGLALLLATPRVKPPAQPAVALGKGEFVALDNEPIDAGLVVRVSLGPNNVQADVIVTADGRARAYRLVSDPKTN